MSVADLNLLSVLDILLEERSVTRAAERLGISAPSVSRALGRLRQATGDPLLVRAGRDLVPTARALELHDDVHRVVEDAAALLRPATLDLATLKRRFTVRVWRGDLDEKFPSIRMRTDRRGFQVVPALIDAGKRYSQV